MGEGEVMVVFFIGHWWDGDSGSRGLGLLQRGVRSECIWHGGWLVDCFACVAAGSRRGGLCRLRRSALASLFLIQNLVQQLLA